MKLNPHSFNTRTKHEHMYVLTVASSKNKIQTLEPMFTELKEYNKTLKQVLYTCKCRGFHHMWEIAYSAIEEANVASDIMERHIGHENQEKFRPVMEKLDVYGEACSCPFSDK